MNIKIIYRLFTNKEKKYIERCQYIEPSEKMTIADVKNDLTSAGFIFVENRLSIDIKFDG